jgi:hypothetical protein
VCGQCLGLEIVGNLGFFQKGEAGKLGLYHSHGSTYLFSMFLAKVFQRLLINDLRFQYLTLSTISTLLAKTMGERFWVFRPIGSHYLLGMDT